MPSIEPILQYGALGLLGLFMTLILIWGGKAANRFVDKSLAPLDGIANNLQQLSERQAVMHRELLSGQNHLMDEIRRRR